MQVKQVLTHTLILTRVGCTHTRSPAAILWGNVAIYPCKLFLLRSGEVQLCVVVERERKASNLHRPQTARQLHSSVQAQSPQEDVCSLPEKVQVSRSCFGHARLLLASIHSHDPSGGRECLVLHAELHSVPLSITDWTLALKSHLAGIFVSPSMELHDQMRVQEGDGEVVRVLLCMKQGGSGLSCADAEGDTAEAVLNLPIAPVVQNAAFNPKCHVRQTWRREMKVT